MKKSKSHDAHPPPPRSHAWREIERDLELTIAHRLKQARKGRGRSLMNVAEESGISYQQLRKYECGANRVSAGRLATIADVLGVPIIYFFADVPLPIPTSETKRIVEPAKASKMPVEWELAYRLIGNVLRAASPIGRD